MKVAVIVPWHDENDVHRYRAAGWVKERYEAVHPDWRWTWGIDQLAYQRPFSRTRAILDGVRKTDADVLVISDADVWSDGTAEAVLALTRQGSGWTVPHHLVHRLSRESTEQVYAGADWRGLELSQDNPQDSRPYVGHEAGTLLVVSRAAFGMAPPDPRFEGWGSEDQAWADALHVMCGAPWRGAADLVHLWHPAQPRLDRVVGNRENAQLANRYRRARESRFGEMRELIAEGVASR